ncbi:MAG: outer membrane protein assembly factor BamA, partial [Alphaproteobacteria bacterium]
PKVIRQSQNRVDLIFEINEGPPTKIRKISFIGNKRFSDRALRDVIQTQESVPWYSLSCLVVCVLFAGADIYDPDILTFDREKLLRHYLSQGYAEFRVVSAVAELSLDRKDFFITFTIEEGARYRFEAINITTQLRALDISKLKPVVTTVVGEWFNNNQIEETINKLTDEVGNFGFAFVDIRSRIQQDRDKRTISVTYEIKEGPRVFVERINIKGNVRTLDEVIRREFRLVEGDAFNSAKFRRSRRRIRDLGFFKKVEMKKVEGTAPDKALINVKVEERRTGSFNIGAGFSSTRGIISQILVTERNLLGKGQQLSAKLTLGVEVQDFDVSFTEPYFLDRNLRVGFDVFQTFRQRSNLAFEEEDTGFRLRTGFDYNEELGQGFDYTLRRRKVTDVDDVTASVFVIGQEESTITSALGQSLSYDVRDSKVDPTEGYIVRLSNDLAGIGGDTQYLRTDLIGTTHYALGKGWVASLRARLGYILGIGEDVRINDRYFLGGESLRGFAPGGVGPRDVGSDAGVILDTPLGGNWFYTATAELSIPIGVFKEFGLKGFVFTDLGSLGGVDDEFDPNPGTNCDVSPADTALPPCPDLKDTGALRLSVGVGAGILTPFGPIRLDFATALLKEDFDETENFIFRLGTRF